MGPRRARRRLGASVRRLRQERGISQEVLAELSGLHRTFVGAVERAERNVSLDNIERLAAALRTDVSFLLCTRRECDPQRLRARAEACEQKQMEAVGALAGGIAHDFNSLLTGMMGLVEVMRVEGGSDFVFGEELRDLEGCVASAAELTRQIRVFARRRTYDVTSLDLNAVVEQRSRDCDGRRPDVAISLDLRARSPILADRAQLEQAVQDLCLHGMAAMPRGGSLSWVTEDVTLDREEADALGVRPGEFVRAAVTDTGDGMDAAACSRVFEPFFTTKKLGRGTGLGLASTQAIVRNHGGAIEAASKPGAGTTFTLWLPAAASAAPAAPPPPALAPRGAATVLVVDDERLVRRVLGRQIEALGYRVLQAASGAEAVEVFGRHGHEIGLVLLDFMMPGMDGSATFDALRRLEPRAKILLCSGFAPPGAVEALLARGCLGLLQKPVERQELAARLREILGDGAGRPLAVSPAGGRRPG